AFDRSIEPLIQRRFSHIGFATLPAIIKKCSGSLENSNMARQFKKVSWLTLAAILIGFPLFGFSLSTHAAEAPGALTVIVKDQITARPLSATHITLTERETSSTRSIETDAQGRIVIEQLDPGVYSGNVSKDGYASSY